MKLLLQIGVVFLICLLGEGIALILPFPFPGSVIAMILLFLLLLFGALKIAELQKQMCCRSSLCGRGFFAVTACEYRWYGCCAALLKELERGVALVENVGREAGYRYLRGDSRERTVGIFISEGLA